MTTLSQAEKRFLVDHSRTDPAWFWDAVLGCSSVYDKQLEMARAVRAVSYTHLTLPTKRIV